MVRHPWGSPKFVRSMGYRMEQSRNARLSPLKRGRKAFCPVPDELFEIVGCDVQFADLAATPKRLGLLVVDLERKAVCITDDEIDRGLRRKTPRHTTFEDFPGINEIPVRRDFDPGGLLRFHFYCERFVRGRWRGFRFRSCGHRGRLRCRRRWWLAVVLPVEKPARAAHSRSVLYFPTLL